MMESVTLSNRGKGKLYWLTGLSGAGKTTIGRLLYSYIRQQRDNVVMLDGDMLREVYQSHDYTQEGRRELAFRNARLCRLLTEQGLDVVACLIAMYEDCRAWNRAHIENYAEIYLDVPLEELVRRDQKQLYSRAIKHEIHNVMGVDISFDAPQYPTLRIDNSGLKTPSEVLAEIVDTLGI